MKSIQLINDTIKFEKLDLHLSNLSRNSIENLFFSIQLSLSDQLHFQEWCGNTVCFAFSKNFEII